MQPIRAALVLLVLALAACGPQIGSLQRGERGRVARVFDGDTLELDSGLRVFLAEIDAPQGEASYAAQSQGELEALALHREVLLAYGGTRRWMRRRPEARAATTEATQPAATAPQEAPAVTAIAHVFVKSEGGRWFWLQHELVARGAAYVRPRRDNHARTADLMGIETQARAAQRGMWGRREYRPLNVRAAAEAALAANTSCLRADAPYRVVEGRVAQVRTFERRASLALESAPDKPFALVVFGDNFTSWDGPALNTLQGAQVRVRGALGMFHEEPQLCLEHASQLEVLGAPAPRRQAAARAGN